jgi:hypothetical protein
MAGSSGIGYGVATINLCRGPALGRSVSRESDDPPKENYGVVKGFYEKIAESTIHQVTWSGFCNLIAPTF